jgi:acyl dehydratase
MRYFDDFKVGEVHETATYTVSREEILTFARQYDPQPFHLDEEAGRNSIFGGLIASGWHTASVCHRLIVEDTLGKAASLGSPGVDELRWLKPVRPGDQLSVRVEVLSLTPSRSKPDRGAIQFRFEVHNQKGEKVMTELATALFSRRLPTP